MKNTAKLSLLLLLGAAQQGLEAKKSLSKDAKIELEKKRVIYHGSKKGECCDRLRLPQIALAWGSQSAVKDVTEAQLNKAKDELKIQEKRVQELEKKRNDYLISKYPAYAEEQKIQKVLNEFWQDNKEKLSLAYQDDMEVHEIYTAENKAQAAFWTYWQLQNQYDEEHQQFLPANHRPYSLEKALTPADMQKLARNAEVINLAPGKSLNLPTLYIGTSTPSPKRVINYTLALPDGKEVSGNTATLKTKTITPNTPVVGAATTYEFIVSSPKHAAPATFYVLEHKQMGDVSVFATVRITKGEDSVPRAEKRGEKPSKPKKAVRKEIMPPVRVPVKAARQQTLPVALVPVKVKHTSGKKAAPASTPAAQKIQKDPQTY